MTSTVELSRVLSLHKNIVNAPSIHLRAGKGFMRLVSAAPSGATLMTKIPSSDEYKSICVDQNVFSVLAKGNGDLSITLDGAKVLVKGNRFKAELPGVFENPPEVTKLESGQISDADSNWLKDVIPSVALPDLDQSGKFSAECSDGEWKISCIDMAHGACVFGKGKSRCAFSLLPSDALKVKGILEVIDKGEGHFGVVESTLIITSANYSATFPTIDGEVQPREEVENDNTKLGSFSAKDFKECLKKVAPFLQDKEAPPLQLIFTGDRLVVKTSSSAGNFSQAIDAKVATQMKVNLSYKLLSHLVAGMGDERVSTSVVLEGADPTRINFKTGDIYYLMLTSA